MIRVKFKTRKAHQAEQYLRQNREPYQDSVESEFFPQHGYADSFVQETPEYPQDTDIASLSCNVCGGEIASNCLEVTFKQNRFHIHTSCVVSAFAIIMNGIGFQSDWLLKKKKQQK